jgi:predicted dithiol-disulfide oxidoreductase (DUF899 family)
VIWIRIRTVGERPNGTSVFQTPVRSCQECPHVTLLFSLVVVARSPVERLTAWKRERGWRNLRLYSDLNDAYSRDYFGVLPDGSEIPSLQRVHSPRRDHPPLLVRRDDRLHDPGQDPRGAPDPAPLWMVLDCTPAGRGGDWYPKLNYDA